MKIDALEKFMDFENEEIKNEFKSLSRGKQEVILTYTRREILAQDNLTDYLIFDHVWEEYMQEIIDFLKELNVEKFIFADNSTESLKCMKIIINNNCNLSVVTYKKEKIFKSTFEYSGILVEL